jgi:septum formation protein
VSKELILNRKIALASTSPFRRELLSQLGIPFEFTAPNVDERALPAESAAATAVRLAAAKACAARLRFPDALIIGSDQVAELDGGHIGKPHTHENAVRQLQQMRGRAVVFHTALAVLDSASGRIETRVVPTTVSFRPVTDEQIEAYLRREEPYECAGSAKSEGLGIALIARIEGSDPNALIGLPLIELISLLKIHGVEVI